MSRISRVGLGWAVPDRIDWYASLEEWYNAERATDYGSLIEAVCKGDLTNDTNGPDLTTDAVHGAWAYADPSVYYDFTNEDIIPFVNADTTILAFDVRISGIYLKTNGVSAGFEPLTLNNKRSLIEDCRIHEVNPAGTSYGVQFNGAGSQANQDILLRCVVSRENAANAIELIKQAQANGYGAVRNCVLLAGAGKYADGSNNVGLEVSDCVGIGSAGYDATSLILNTSSSEDSSGTAGLTLIDETALANFAGNDFRSKSGGALDVTGTNTAFIGVGLDAAVGNGITLTPFSSTGTKIFQRNLDNSPRSINVDVSLTGDPSGGIEWRLVDAADDTVITGYDWATFLASPATGGHTQAITVPTGTTGTLPLLFKLQLRFTADTGAVANSVNPFGVGVVAVDYGQSNSEYRETYVSGSPPVPSPFASYVNSDWLNTFVNADGAIQKANDLVDLFKCPVAYINVGAASASITTLASGSHWSEFQTQISHADNEVEFVTFDQGETDAKAPMSATDYQTYSQTLFDNIKGLSAFNNLYMTMVVNYGGNSSGYSPAEYTDVTIEAIRQGKRDFVSANARAIFGAHRIDLPLSGTIHNPATAYAIAATREVYTYAQYLGLSVSPQKGREVVSADLSGDTVTVTYSAGDPLTKVGAGASTITQISEDDFSTLLTITATVVNADTVVHTLSTTPTNSIKVREYYGAENDVTTRPDLVFPSAEVIAAITSILTVTVTGIPDGAYMTVLDDENGNRISRQLETYTGGVLSVTIPIGVTSTIKGYVDDGLNPSVNGAYLEGITA